MNRKATILRLRELHKCSEEFESLEVIEEDAEALEFAIKELEEVTCRVCENRKYDYIAEGIKICKKCGEKLLGVYESDK